jgi:S-DNA-T family DNA segregation ATPase FtsK/SpoIIIE
MVRTTQPEKPAESSFADDAVTTLFQLGWLTLRFAAILLWWAILFPTISVPLAVAGYASMPSVLGWIWGICIAPVALALHIAWWMFWPRSFRRFVSGRVWKRWRRWRVYRRPWKALCGLHGLTKTLDQAILVPKIKKLTVGYNHDVLRIRLLTGQTVTDWASRAEALAHAFEAPFVQVVSDAPGWVALVVQHTDNLSTPIHPNAPADPVDLEQLSIGKTDAGAPWIIRVLGRHLLIAGATGAGKGSIVWSILTALAPSVRDGVTALWVIDPKGGMEFGRGARLFSRFSYDTGENTLALLRDAAQALTDRANRLRGVTRQHTPSVAEPLIVIVIDELASLTAYITDRKVKAEVEQLLGLILSQGRAVGVSVIACVQDPSKDVLAFRQLFPVRIGLRLAEASQVTMVLGPGARDRGAHCDAISDQTPGVGYVAEDGVAEPVRVRAFHVTDRDIDKLTTSYQPPTLAADDTTEEE